jgi:hypothetical protein
MHVPDMKEPPAVYPDAVVAQEIAFLQENEVHVLIT